MGYSEVVFDTVASILMSPGQPKQAGSLRGMDDYVIALSIDSGLPVEDVRSQLEMRMNLMRDGDNVSIQA